MSNVTPIRPVRRPHMETWIRMCVNTKNRRSSKLSMVSLVYCVDGIETELHIHRLAKSDTATILADLFHKKVDAHAKTVPGMKVYNLIAFWDIKQEGARFVHYVA